MASQQDPRAREDVRGKELRAEDAARAAADELRDVNKQRSGSVVVEQEQQSDQNRPGIIGSIFQTLGGAKDAVIGKTHEATDKATVVSRDAAERERRNNQEATRKAEEYKDSAAQKAKEAKDTTMGKMGEYNDYAADKTKQTADATAQKAKEAKDYTLDKTKEAKDATMDKMGEYKDYAAQKGHDTKEYTSDKAKEGKDSAVGKLTEFKDKAIDFFSGKKDETKENFPKGTFKENEEDARRKLETMHLKDQGYEAKGTAMDATATSGGSRRGEGRDDGVAVAAAAADAFRKSDQMSGQAFNDVGGMEEDAGGARGGVYRVQLKHDNK